MFTTARREGIRDIATRTLHTSPPANVSALACGFATGAAIVLLLNVLMRNARRTHGAEEGGYPYTSRAPLL